jgi:hypothetical protein
MGKGDGNIRFQGIVPVIGANPGRFPEAYHNKDLGCVMEPGFEIACFDSPEHGRRFDDQELPWLDIACRWSHSSGFRNPVEYFAGHRPFWIVIPDAFALLDEFGKIHQVKEKRKIRFFSTSLP